MFCQHCGMSNTDVANYCASCGKEIKPDLASTSKTSGNIAEKDLPKPPKTIQSFAYFKTNKSQQWNKKVKKDKKDKKEEVTISIGMIIFSLQDGKLKPKRGKRLALIVTVDETYFSILSRAREKWRLFYSDCFEQDYDYVLTFEDGSEAVNMPGQNKPFNIKEYHIETGKDYKRIVLYLCTEKDILLNERKFLPFPSVNEDTESDEEANSSKKIKLSPQILEDEVLARQLQERFDDDEGSNTDCISLLPSVRDIGEDVSNVSAPLVFAKINDVVQHLKKQVDQKGQFFIVVRRGASLERRLVIWNRSCKKYKPSLSLAVSYSGEDGIDSGAISKAFLTAIINDISNDIFPRGIPIDSMQYVHNKIFETCGQIAAVSLSQGGPPPQFFDEKVFDMLAQPERFSLSDLKESQLTENEKCSLEKIKANPVEYQDFIIDNGYTGLISKSNIDEIVGTIIVNTVNKRMVYLKEFRTGLELFGVDEIMKNNLVLLKELFVKSTKIEEVDANYVVSLIDASYSAEGTSRRSVEDKIIDNMQDYLMLLEDEKCEGSCEAIAYADGTDERCSENRTDEQCSEIRTDEQCSEIAEVSEDVNEEEVMADMTPAGVFSWITGQRHKPIDGELIKIHLTFDHECMERNPNHRLCFPIVGACGRTITIPVAHMKTPEEFKEVFQLAYCKGQSFGRP